MSYWETLLVILRRWPISVPAVLVSIGLGVAAFVVSPPQYEDNTQVLFIGSPNQPGVKTRVNPYLGLGSALIQTAAVIQATVSTPQVADNLYKQGATGLYLVGADVSTPAPVLLVTVKAADPAVARRTTDAVVAEIKKELLDVQQEAGAPESQFVQTTIISALPEPQRKIVASIRPAITASAGFFTLAMFALFLLEGRRQRKRRATDSPHQSGDTSSEPANLYPGAGGPDHVPPYQQPAPQYQQPAPQYLQPAPLPQYQQPAPAPQFQPPAAAPQFQPPAAAPPYQSAPAPQYQQPMRPADAQNGAPAADPRYRPGDAAAASRAAGPNGATPNAAPPNSAPPNGATPNSAPPNGLVQNGAVQNVTAPNGLVPKGLVPNGTAPNGTAPNGTVPNGTVPNGTVPNGTVPNGTVPNAVPMIRPQPGATWDAPVQQEHIPYGNDWETPPRGAPINRDGSPDQDMQSWFDLIDQPRGTHDRRN